MTLTSRLRRNPLLARADETMAPVKHELKSIELNSQSLHGTSRSCIALVVSTVVIRFNEITTYAISLHITT